MQDTLLHTLDSFADRNILLKKVEYVIDLKNLDAVRLSFASKRQLIFGIDTATDSILMLSSLPPGVKFHDVSSRVPWREAINKYLVWGWALYNHLGCRDGVQLQFDRKLAKAIQLVAIASSFKVYEITIRDSYPFLLDG